MRTPNQRLADLLLQEPVEEWVKRKRNEGLSWRHVSLALRDSIDLDIAPGTLLTWVDEARQEHSDDARVAS